MRWLAAALLAATTALACGPVAAESTPRPVLVLGAASLRNPLEAIRAAWPGPPLTIATDSSAALRAQIEQGAPADVFLSADTAQPAALVAAGLADGPPVPFARNGLTVVVPADNPAGIRSPGDLGRDGVRIIAAGDAVPITRYALEAADRLGIRDWYVANVVSREDNVAAVVARIALGEGDAAFVYATDAAAAGDRVVTIGIPPEANVTATYAAVVVASDDPSPGRAFVDWLLRAEGQAILARFGFLPPT